MIKHIWSQFSLSYTRFRLEAYLVSVCLRVPVGNSVYAGIQGGPGPIGASKSCRVLNSNYVGRGPQSAGSYSLSSRGRFELRRRV